MPNKPRNPPPPKSQAERVIEKFGGATELALALEAHCEPAGTLHRSAIYRWTYSRERGGTGGVIPTAAWPAILLAARKEGIFLTEDDFFPGVK